LKELLEDMICGGGESQSHLSKMYDINLNVVSLISVPAECSSDNSDKSSDDDTDDDVNDENYASEDDEDADSEYFSQATASAMSFS